MEHHVASLLETSRACGVLCLFLPDDNRRPRTFYGNFLLRVIELPLSGFLATRDWRASEMGPMGRKRAR